MAYFKKYKFSNSEYNTNSGKIFDIELSGGTAPYTVNWYGPSGYTSGPYTTNPSTDLNNLAPGIYTGFVSDALAATGKTIVEIDRNNQLILSASVTDYSCVTGGGNTCKIKVNSFQHTRNCFRYELYKDLTLVQTYSGCTGDEIYEFSGLTDDNYTVKAIESSDVIYYYKFTSGCTDEDISIGNTTNPDDVVSGWTRFSFFSEGVSGMLPITKTGLRPNGYITSGDSTCYFYTGNTNPYYLGEFNLLMNEGDDVGPSGATLTLDKKFYYNSYINKFIVCFDVAGASIYKWATFNPTNDLDLSGNPTTTTYLTTATNWSTSALTTNQFTISGDSNIVVSATTKIMDAGGVPKMINCSNNSAVFNGFYSPCEYLNYVHEVTLGSTDNDDDNIGIVLAAFKDTEGIYGVKDITYTIIAAPNISAHRVGIYYNAGQSAYAFNDGSTGFSTSLIISNNSPFLTGFFNYDVQGNVRFRITRSGNSGELFSIEMTDTMGNTGSTQTKAKKNIGQSNPYNPAYTINFSLLDKSTWVNAPAYAVGSELTKFLGSQKYGYATQSQANSQFFDITFSGQQTNIIAVENVENGDNISITLETSTTYTGSCYNCITVCDGNFTKQTIDNVSTNIQIISDNGNDLSQCFIITPEIICDPKPEYEQTNCGCDIVGEDSALSLCINVNEQSISSACTVNDSFNIVLNPNGNDGVYFNVDNFETCTLNIAFDYLFKLKCSTLLDLLTPPIGNIINSGCTTIMNVFEKLDISLNLDVVSGSSLINVYENNFFKSIGDGNLYDYVTQTSGKTGFFVTSNDIDGIILGPTEQNCPIVSDNIVDSLWIQSNLPNTQVGNNTFINNVNLESFNSNWLNFSVNITDENVINQLIDNKIKISIRINHTCSDFCLLLDNIKLNKNCDKVDTNTLQITRSPGFELERVIDNKKSWKDTTINRSFDIKKPDITEPIRQTDYKVSDERLVINTKEIDLDINIASAIESDVWSFISDNPCLLSGCGPSDICCFKDCLVDNTCCGDNKIDFNNLLTQPLSGVTTLEDFIYFIKSELIDAKNRQTISSYATLKALYDRYLNSEFYCGISSSKFNYLNIDQFAKLIGTFWVDLVEQVVPATTIWGSTKIYTNTLFDQQKYQYKSYTLQLCGNPLTSNLVLSPIVNACFTANTITTNISTNTAPLQTVVKSICNNVCIIQGNAGSEFIGKVKTSACDDIIIINECDLKISITTYSDGTAEVFITGGTSPLRYLWSTGDHTKIISGLTNGTYSVTVIDSNCCGVTVQFEYNDLICGNKEFQDGDCFFFMDGTPYDFMN